MLDPPTSEANHVDTTLEAAELPRLRSRDTHTQPAPPPAASQNSNNQTHHLPFHRWQSLLSLVFDPIQKIWSRQVSVIVPHDACRDHLALERTYLAYLRTSLAFSSLGIAIAQLFRLQPTFGIFVLGKPLACICQGAAIYSLFLGTYRSWRLQNAMLRGKAIAGGIELVLLGLGMLILVVAFLVLIIAVG